MTITVALIMAITMIVLLILGVPICIAIAISSILAGANALDFNMMLQTGAQRTFTGISVFTLIAIPFFILAGNIMNQGGIAIRLMNFARLLVGKIPGSYAHTNSMANMMFGAISGSGVAAASAMGTIIGPIAVKRTYYLFIGIRRNLCCRIVPCWLHTGYSLGFKLHGRSLFLGQENRIQRRQPENHRSFGA